MDYGEFMDQWDFKYNYLAKDLDKDHPLTEAILKDLQVTNASVRNDMYLQDYIRLRCISMLDIYHEHLRSVLKEAAQVDIGELFKYD